MNRGRLLGLTAGSITSVVVGAVAAYFFGPSMGVTIDGGHPLKAPPDGLRLERSERANPLSGVVMYGDLPLDDAWVTAGDERIYTDETGTFAFEDVPLGVVSVTRPGYLPIEYEFDGSASEVTIPMEVRIVRALWISSTWAVDDAQMEELFSMTTVTSINAVMFDSKSENNGYVDYNTQVPAAVNNRLLADEVYDAAERLRQAKDIGLYTMMRVPVFKDPIYANAHPQHVLAGNWMDPSKPESWEYPLALAVEACELGFDEVQFDYIRYPTGAPYNQASAQGRIPGQAGRVANIKGFLQEASDRLHPLGCAISADNFGGTTISTDDYGIGQLFEEFSEPLDAVSPMTYPDLWPAGSFGFDQPVNKPKEVVAAQLDAAIPRLPEGTVLRPLLRTAWWPDSWILVQIQVAEERGLGWVLWGTYEDPITASAVPPGTDGEG